MGLFKQIKKKGAARRARKLARWYGGDAMQELQDREEKRAQKQARKERRSK